MERLGVTRFTDDMTDTTAPTASTARPTLDLVRRTLQRRSFAVLSTVSPAGRPHAAGVAYSLAGDDLYLSTMRESRKARNLVANPWAGVVVPVRRLPVGPPATVQFQGRAELLDLDDPEIVGLASDGQLKAITSHGELELAGGCFVRITPSHRVHTYGLGLSLRQLLRDPLAAGGSVEWPTRSG
jgi:hypothetical protein